MKNRVENILKISTAGWWIGTFHSMGARILRKNPEVVGLKKQFTINSPINKVNNGVGIWGG